MDLPLCVTVQSRYARPIKELRCASKRISARGTLWHHGCQQVKARNAKLELASRYSSFCSGQMLSETSRSDSRKGRLDHPPCKVSAVPSCVCTLYDQAGVHDMQELHPSGTTHFRAVRSFLHGARPTASIGAVVPKQAMLTHVCLLATHIQGCDKLAFWDTTSCNVESGLLQLSMSMLSRSCLLCDRNVTLQAYRASEWLLTHALLHQN